jgi:hypothetical protein
MSMTTKMWKGHEQEDALLIWNANVHAQDLCAEALMGSYVYAQGQAQGHDDHVEGHDDHDDHDDDHNDDGQKQTSSPTLTAMSSTTWVSRC